jgi:hypothetical protein
MNSPDDIDASFGFSSDRYTNGEETPRFKQWLQEYKDVVVSEETLPLLKEIYHAFIYNVPLPKDASVENYILQLEERKKAFENRLEDFRKRFAIGEAEAMNFNPETGEIESEETYQDIINQYQRKIDILQNARLEK